MSSDGTEYREKLTSECFFLEDRSSVVSYKLSTKFRRHGTFTSFFTVCGRTIKAQEKFILKDPNELNLLYLITYIHV